ncbi:MAG: 1-acyl-sn-glycerol-3-phosphate acyltransferase [Planctomycetaceae bacterium]|jgi:1-acyl-sn-glycerol-3-phosphate acyltransferase|nr:1-acyl-sn-glycerol-3-phosphate acyltransferase [Planctomycetaceae bacterium]
MIATSVLVLAFLSPLFMAVGYARRSHLNFAQALLWMPIAMLTLFQWKTRLHGRLNSLATGAILICNHRSSVDGLIVQMACDKPVGCLVAREYVEIPVLRHLFRFLGMIPVGRQGVDTQATKRAIREAASGRIVLMFPEGRLNTTLELMQSCRPGAVMVAIRAGVPIVPFYLGNITFTNALFNPFVSRGRVQLTVGEPIDVVKLSQGKTDKQTLGEILKICLREIAKLAEEVDWEPQVAGRNWNH